MEGSYPEQVPPALFTFCGTTVPSELTDAEKKLVQSRGSNSAINTPLDPIKMVEHYTKEEIDVKGIIEGN